MGETAVDMTTVRLLDVSKKGGDATLKGNIFFFFFFFLFFFFFFLFREAFTEKGGEYFHVKSIKKMCPVKILVRMRGLI